jgi:hypothetical protein
MNLEDFVHQARAFFNIESTHSEVVTLLPQSQLRLKHLVDLW